MIYQLTVLNILMFSSCFVFDYILYAVWPKRN